MPSSDKTFAVTLHVKNAKRSMDLYGDKIVEGKRYKNVSQAFNDMLANMLDFIEVLRKDREKQEQDRKDNDIRVSP